MQDLLSEVLVELYKDANNAPMLVIHQNIDDGLAHVAKRKHCLQLTEYGLFALERNLIAMLGVIDRYKQGHQTRLEVKTIKRIYKIQGESQVIES